MTVNRRANRKKQEIKFERVSSMGHDERRDRSDDKQRNLPSDEQHYQQSIKYQHITVLLSCSSSLKRNKEVDAECQMYSGTTKQDREI